jgi:hypothetical protein
MRIRSDLHDLFVWLLYFLRDTLIVFALAALVGLSMIYKSYDNIGLAVRALVLFAGISRFLVPPPAQGRAAYGHCAQIGLLLGLLFGLYLWFTFVFVSMIAPVAAHLPAILVYVLATVLFLIIGFCIGCVSVELKGEVTGGPSCGKMRVLTTH